MHNGIELISIDFEKLDKDMSIISYEDFYKETGILDYIKDITNEDGKYHYSNIQANEFTINMIDDMLKRHLIKGKNKYSRMYKKNVLETMSAMDRLMWSPKRNNNIDSLVIKMITKDSDEYTEAVRY